MEPHYQDGKWVKEEDAKISVFDITVLRGFGVFDFLRTYNKKPFLLDDHIDRLFASADEVGVTIPRTKSELVEIVNEGVRRSTFDELYIKLIVTGGVSPDGISPGTPSLICLFLKAGTWSPDCINKGIVLKSVEFERYIPRSKSLNYMTAVVSMQKAKKEGASDVLYIGYDGSILEGTTFNFFAVMGNKLYTSEDDILYGCTRKIILKLAKELGVEVVVGPINKDQMSKFDEAFISSTTREIHPVVKIDDATIGNGTPGETTKKILAAFNTAKNL
eukprot:TRINITY_DN1886_c0_g1_i1.p1 TRINITY_DN1886_c0_g1~~TRINITY_DN1886_c0_g1_i1.p1  ORF type:complete len:275 (-),score=71.10 TRINITY_DN1886_c0_g1_i1:33-857(-)